MKKRIINSQMERTRGIVDVLHDSDVPKPLLLYKYYAFDKWSRCIFKDNEIYFSSPESFNDPFDSKIRVIYEGTRTQRKHFLKKWAKEYRSDLPRKERLGYEKKIRKQELDLQMMPTGIQKGLIAARKRMGVFCMTEDRQNILMWSHYAAEHTGFCIELQTDNTFFARARPVHYDKVLPCLNLLESMWDKLVTKGAAGLLTKAQDWAYEKEWRIVEIDGAGVHKYPPDALNGIILGCKMSEENKKRIKDWCRERKLRPALSEAKEKEQEFGIDIISIS